MANTQFEVLGPESSVIYYNLNKQFSTVKKLVITKEIILDSFETSQVKSFFEDLSQTSFDSYTQELRDREVDLMFEEDFHSEFHRIIQDSLTKLYDNMSEIKLKDYNFMSAVSNVQFTITLRTSSTCFHRYYVEKGAILSNIKHLLKEYVTFEGTSFNPSRVRNFQIEIYETIEPFKQVYLKKDADGLVLSSSFGFSRISPVSYQIGPELYFSRGEAFTFYKNAQHSALLREHTKINEVDITQQEKVLSNEDLVAVNNITKNINDALIEIIITKKNEVKIVNVSLLDNSLTTASDKGIVLNKSSSSPEKISILTLRDHHMEETPNTKYLLIRNQEEVRELMSQLRVLTYFKGIIFNTNFYHPIFDTLGTQFDLDVIFYTPKLSKNFSSSINFTDLFIEDSAESTTSNPFSSILDEQQKKERSFVDTFQDLDLNTPEKRPEQSQTNNQIGQLAQGIISSPNASTSRQAEAPSSPTNWGSSATGEKQSAIGMLAQAVVSNNNQPVKEPEPIPVPQEEPKQDFSSSSLVMNDVSSSDINPMKFEEFDKMKEAHESKTEIKILSVPTVHSSSAFFVDSHSISRVTSQAELFYVVTRKEDMQNSSINYVIPVSMANWDEGDCYYLINNPVDYFLAPENQGKFFINLTQVERNLREGFIKHSVNRFGTCSIIVLKEDLELLTPYVDRLNNVFIKDATTDQELAEVRHLLQQKKDKPVFDTSSLY